MKSNEAVCIFPHQLFENHPALDKKRHIFIVEAPRYFTEFSFHKQKLVFHHASMHAYADQLKKKRYTVSYITVNDFKALPTLLKKKSMTSVHYAQLVDTPFEKTLTKLLRSFECIEYETPAFLSPPDWLAAQFKNKKRFFMRPFYVAQRKRMKLLMKNGKPIGGKWSFDAENRNPLSQDVKIPTIKKPRTNKYVTAALKHVEKEFKKNPGSTKLFMYPITNTAAKKWLKDFLDTRLANFGPYQDAITQENHLLFHSILSPLLNSGLLTPEYIVEKTIQHAQIKKTPIQSVEGFLRQIIGWREFVRAVYEKVGTTQRDSNFFKHRKKLSSSFWQGTTDIKPIDSTIEYILHTGYAHHIERLMLLGNFMLLSHIHPNYVYRWFMELFIDAYDWVMVPNVYGMSQYADGGLMTTKPYISSSAYILRMSDYKKNEWNTLWDSLYWYFLFFHKKKLIKNNRIRLAYTHLNKMNKTTFQKHKKRAEAYLGK